MVSHGDIALAAFIAENVNYQSEICPFVASLSLCLSVCLSVCVFYGSGYNAASAPRQSQPVAVAATRPAYVSSFLSDGRHDCIAYSSVIGGVS